MAPLVNFSGIASGIDSSSLIKALLDQQRKARIDPLDTKISAYKDTNSSFDELSSLLEKLKTATDKFRVINGSVLNKFSISSDETVATASASNSATNGSYTLNVSALAKNATYALKSTSTYSSADAVINSSINNSAALADRQVTVSTGTGSDLESVSIALTNTSSLNDFVTQYNSQSTKSVASLVNVGTSSSPDYRVIITGNNSGVSKGQVLVAVGSEVSSTGTGAFNSNSVSQATDANFSLTGIGAGLGDTITRSSNQISDVIPGLTFTLQDTGSTTISVNDDTDTSASAIQDFVDAYNEIVKYIADNDLVTQAQDGNETTNIFGALSNTSLDENVISALRNAFSGAGTTGRSVNVLADLGITTERDGTLKFDSSTFEEAVSSDSEGVRLITQNLGERLGGTNGTIAQFTRFNGLIDQSINSNNTLITDLESKISAVEKSLSTEQASLTQRFSRLEALIGQLNSQQSTLASILPG